MTDIKGAFEHSSSENEFCSMRPCFPSMTWWTTAESNICHSSSIAVCNSARVTGSEKRVRIAHPRTSQRFSMGLRPIEYAGYSIRAIPWISIDGSFEFAKYKQTCNTALAISCSKQLRDLSPTNLAKQIVYRICMYISNNVENGLCVLNGGFNVVIRNCSFSTYKPYVVQRFFMLLLCEGCLSANTIYVWM